MGKCNTLYTIQLTWPAGSLNGISGSDIVSNRQQPARYPAHGNDFGKVESPNAYFKIYYCEFILIVRSISPTRANSDQIESRVRDPYTYIA